ncbi:hypothetical protein C8J57DRAFT_1465802 [Mycena rebaudengoi]|nr:hypothetical protein C8J57DRAFT_1465802 [Mycena rebaudengoi]
MSSPASPAEIADTRSGLAKLPQGCPFPASLTMRPILIQGSQVTFDGGTFNDVAGNMNQTFTAIVSQQRADGPPILAGYSDDHPPFQRAVGSVSLIDTATRRGTVPNSPRLASTSQFTTRPHATAVLPAERIWVPHTAHARWSYSPTKRYIPPPSSNPKNSRHAVPSLKLSARMDIANTIRVVFDTPTVLYHQREKLRGRR